MAKKTGSLRIAYGRISQESNALSPVRTTRRDFEDIHLFGGVALAEVCGPRKHELKNFMKNGELSGFVQRVEKVARPKFGANVELVPLLSAWAVPSGPLTEECFRGLVEEMCLRLEAAGPLDALYLSLHGAMGVVGRPGAEAEIVRRCREIVGEGTPIVITLDLHANVTKELFERCEAMISYRTNPHRDHKQVGASAADIVLGTLTERVRPRMAWRSLPMLVGGSPTLEFWPPLRAIWKKMRRYEKTHARVLSCSVNTCHPWNDHPELGWSVTVVTDDDEALAERIADELAEMCWQTRDKLPPAFRSPAEAIARARSSRIARKTGVVVLSDASDVVSAGATGESTRMLSALLEHGQGLRSLMGLRDPAAVDELWDTPIGTTVRQFQLGGKLDPGRNPGLVVDLTVKHRVKNDGVGRTVVVDVGDVTVVIVEGPALVVQPRFFKMAGQSILKADIVVVKNFFPFLVFFLPYMRKVIFVKTEGITDFDAAHEISFAGPMHPKDTVLDWRETDTRRREGSPPKSTGSAPKPSAAAAA